jgi:hypothetical protein
VSTFSNLAAIDADGHHPDEHVKISWPYEVGILAAHRLERVMQVATRDGVTVRHEKFGGVLVKYGRVHAEGRWGDVRVLLAAVEQLAEDLDLD